MGTLSRPLKGTQGRWNSFVTLFSLSLSLPFFPLLRLHGTLIWSTKLSIVCIDHLVVLHPLVVRDYSVTAAGAPVVDISAEDIARWSGTTATDRRTGRPGGLRHRLRCDAGAVRAVTLAQPVLPAGLCHSVPVRRQAGPGTCHHRKVSRTDAVVATV